MPVTISAWVIATAGLMLISVLVVLQLIAILKPYSIWTIKNVYGGDPGRTDAKAYFAFNDNLNIRAQ